MDSEKTTTEHLDAQENLETLVQEENLQEDNIAPYEEPEQENIPEPTQEQPVQEPIQEVNITL